MPRPAREISPYLRAESAIDAQNEHWHLNVIRQPGCAPAGYLMAGVILTVFAVAFTAISTYIRNAGAFYSYIARGLGKPAGLGAAALAVFSYNAIQIGLYGAFGYFAALTAKDLAGITLPWWAWAGAGIAAVWFFGYRSIHAGAKILSALLVAESVSWPCSPPPSLSRAARTA